jgi:membrane-associated protease RseP (regulator of RpoE activity)
MPLGLRFCRNCGYRLGEGVAEYTETVRFQNGPGGHALTATPPNYATAYGVGGGPVGASAARQLSRKGRRKMSGLTWMFVALVAIFGLAGGATQLARRAVSRTGFGRTLIAPSRSYLGVNDLQTVDGGVTFGNVTPGSEMDKAGLVGGDIITLFDGQAINSEDQMIDLLRQTPIGKTVDVIYIRDGETKTTKITTISESDSDRLTRAFRGRSEGIGRFGYDPSDVKQVQVPGAKHNGVLLKRLTPNQSADVAGLQAGDIVIELEDGGVKVPIRTAEELISRTRRAKPFTTIKVVVMRGDQRLEIPVNMGRQ